MADIFFDEASFSSALLDTVGAIIVVLDSEDRILLINRTCEQLFGYSQADIYGKSYQHLLLEQEVSGVQEVIRRLFDGEDRVDHQNHWIAKNGDLKFIEWSNKALKGKDGQVQYVLATGIDVTEQKAHEQKILKLNDELELRVYERTAALEHQIQQGQILQQKLNDLLRINPVVIVSSQPVLPYRINYISENVETIFGYRPEQLINDPLPWSKMVHPEDKMRAPDLIIALQSSDSASSEVLIRRADGQYRNVLVAASLIRDVTNNPVEIHFSLQDITVQREYEQEIREREELYRSLAESAQELISVISKDGTFAYVNRFGAQLFGLQPEEMMGRHRQDFFPSEQANQQTEILENVFTQDQVINYDELVNLPGGSTWFGTRMMPIHGKDGVVNAVLGISRDITARKRVENELKIALQKQKELNELQANFISMITHQFGTPLSTILSSAEMLAEYGENWSGERRLKHHQKIVLSAQRINAMMQDILELGRANGVADRINFQPVDLVALCKNVVESIQSADQGHHNILFYGPKVPIVCQMDEHLIVHSLENLLTNAVKYSGDNTPIEIGVDLEGERIRIWIKDHGMGIPQQDLNLVGTSFYRAKNVSRIPGTGLGLAFVKRSMAALNGTFDIQSQEKVGTVVELCLAYLPAVLTPETGGGDG